MQELQRLLMINQPKEEPSQFSTQNNYTQIINNFRGPKSINNFGTGNSNNILNPKHEQMKSSESEKSNVVKTKVVYGVHGAPKVLPTNKPPMSQSQILQTAISLSRQGSGQRA